MLIVEIIPDMALKQLQCLVSLSMIFHQITESNSYFITAPGIHTTIGEGQALSLPWEFGSGGFINDVLMLHGDMCVIHYVFGFKFDCSGNSLDTSVRDIDVAGGSINHVIHSVDREDAGYYTCVIRMGAANYTDSNAVIYVFDKPDKAKVISSGSNHEGSDFTLQCHADSTSLPAANQIQVNMVYTWRNNSADLDPDDLPKRYSITSSGDPANAVNDLLVITSLSRHDAGSYTCYGHENGSTLLSDTSNSYMLIPWFAPYSVQVNQSAEIIEYERLGPVLCSAVCNPPCTYSWYKGDSQVSSNAGLIIHNVTRDNHGVYECRPDNGIPGGQTVDFDLTVFYGPSVLSFDVVSPVGPISQHDDVRILCQTDSRPAPVITLIRPSGDTLVSSSTSNILKHTLTDIDCLDSGYYKCVAFNALTGRQGSTLVSIAVQCLPRKHSTSNSTVAAAEGDTVTLSITVVAFPAPTFTWYKPHEGYFTMTRTTKWCSVHVYMSSSITISHITHSDYGNYSVTAGNPLGVMEDAVFSLTAAGKPNIPTKLRVHHANAVSITMQWTSGWNRGGEQVFTLMYRRSGSDDSYTNITDIRDPGQGETFRAKAVGLLPDTSYDFIVKAKNRFGSIETKSIAALSAEAPLMDTDESLSVAISGNTASIKWPLHSYSGPITNVNINSCDVSSARCLLTTVLNITSTVEVSVPEGGPSYSFVFMVHDGDDLLLNVNHFIKTDTGPSTGLVVGVVVAAVVLCVVAAIKGVIVWRRRSRGTASKGRDSLQRQARQMCDSRLDKNHENDSPREREVSISDHPRMQQEQSPYEQIEDSAHPTFSVPSVYERPQTPRSVVVPAVYETLHPDVIHTTPNAGQSDNLEISEYANMA